MEEVRIIKGRGGRESEADGGTENFSQQQRESESVSKHGHAKQLS